MHLLLLLILHVYLQVKRVLTFMKRIPDKRRLECIKHGKFDIYKVI